MNNRKNAAFTVELLGLFILLTAVITAVTGVFVMTRAQSLQARQLTEAVILAQNTAELCSAASSEESLPEVLSAMDNSGGRGCFTLEDDGRLAVYASMKGSAESAHDPLYMITVSREYPEDSKEYARDTISVYSTDAEAGADFAGPPEHAGKKPVYTLVSGTFFGQEGGRP